jgi:uncharacterized membrane protein
MQSRKEKRVNAADLEHMGALIAGGLLMLIGMTRRGVAGALYNVAGAALLVRGGRGYRPLYDKLGLAFPERPTSAGRGGIRVESSIVIHRPVTEVYRIWRHLENLPAFMPHLVEVREVDDVRSHWVAKAPLGMVVEWDAQIINDKEDEMIAWQSLEGSGVDQAGSIHFEDAEGGTKLRVVLRYDPPGDALGAWFARLLHSDPQAQIEEDLRRFKAMIESQEPLALSPQSARGAGDAQSADEAMESR